MIDNTRPGSLEEEAFDRLVRQALFEELARFTGPVPGGWQRLVTRLKREASGRVDHPPTSPSSILDYRHIDRDVKLEA